MAMIKMTIIRMAMTRIVMMIDDNDHDFNDQDDDIRDEDDHDYHDQDDNDQDDKRLTITCIRIKVSNGNESSPVDVIPVTFLPGLLVKLEKKLKMAAN